jgi:hypothetical protein
MHVLRLLSLQPVHCVQLGFSTFNFLPIDMEFMIGLYGWSFVIGGTWGQRHAACSDQKVGLPTNLLLVVVSVWPSTCFKIGIYCTQQSAGFSQLPCCCWSIEAD